MHLVACHLLHQTNSLESLIMFHSLMRFDCLVETISLVFSKMTTDKKNKSDFLFLCLFKYGAAYPPNQYGVPQGAYPGTPTSNGQV